MLLSHHQPFSAYEHDGPELKAKLGQALDARTVDVWFWGHEHRCVAYRPYEGVRHGRCIGHDGVPVYQWHDQSAALPQNVDYEFREYIDRGVEHWARFGFVVCDFDGPAIEVSYIDEDGAEHHHERLQ
jgi:hypothetical protein